MRYRRLALELAGVAVFGALSYSLVDRVRAAAQLQAQESVVRAKEQYEKRVDKLLQILSLYPNATILRFDNVNLGGTIGDAPLKAPLVLLGEHNVLANLSFVTDYEYRDTERYDEAP